MSKKDYEKAALIVQKISKSQSGPLVAYTVMNAFIDLFENNPRFDSARFQRACVPGANVKAKVK